MAFEPKFSYILTRGKKDLVSKIKEKIMASMKDTDSPTSSKVSVQECVNCLSCGVACSQVLCDDCLDKTYPKDRAKRMTSTEKE